MSSTSAQPGNDLHQKVATQQLHDTRERSESIEARQQTEAHEGRSFTSSESLMKDLMDA